MKNPRKPKPPSHSVSVCASGESADNVRPRQFDGTEIPDFLLEAGDRFTKRKGGTWVHESGATIEFTKKDGYTATIYKSIRGQRATITLNGVSLNIAAGWIDINP